jgi:ABC-2 type transport system permease protein
MSGTFTPRPGGASPVRMALAQGGLELRLLLRNGEQMLLSLVIPLLLLGFLGAGGDRDIDEVVPGILALAVLSTAFTGLAIGTGFERRYGVLKRLGTTPLPRWGLLAGKTLAVLAVEVVQCAAVVGLGLALGWSPSRESPVATVAVTALLILVGTMACAGLGLLMAGTLRAEATLAAANLVYLVLLLTGGVVVSLDRFPAAARPWLEATPLGALASGLRSVLTGADTLPATPLLALLAWAVAGLTAAALTFRWD